MPETPPVTDLRSDTITRPTPGMLEAMARAKVGDDVLGDDPTVIELQERVAAMLGHEAALFVPSGTMANLLAIRGHTRPGDEILLHAGSHIFHYETAGYAAINGCGTRPIESPDGIYPPEALPPLVRPRDTHFARTRLVHLENTHNKGGGTVWPLDAFGAVAGRASELGLARHLDGARLWNAAAASGHEVSAYASLVDSVSVCFSKGLGAPVGSALAGSRDFIRDADRGRKMLGGTMRQSGLLAAAALHALDHHLDRLGEDHANAALLADGLAGIPGIELDRGRVQTNIVYFDTPGRDASAVCRRLDELGVRTFDTGPHTLRAVTHLDVTREQIAASIGVFARAIEETPISAQSALLSPDVR